MNKKTKLVATIMAMCLVITLGVIGIFAVKTLNMSVGGNITFSADGLSLEVSAGIFKDDKDAKYEGITTQTGKMQGFVMNTDTKLSEIQSLVDSWAGLELVLSGQGDAILHFTVKNTMTTPLYVYVATDLGENTNNNMNLVVSPNGAEIEAGVTKAFAITFDIIDTNINAGLKGFNVAINFSKESLLKPQNKVNAGGQQTSEVDYYYLEMGTYNGQPVRWRYVADKNGNVYDGTSAVTSLSGYYVLETNVNFGGSFTAYERIDGYYHNTAGYTNILCNDYALSDIRGKLTNEGSGGFLQRIGVETNNLIYSLIQARTMTDLYSNILGEDGRAITSSNTKYALSLTGDKSVLAQSDKLWLMSQSEVIKFFPNVSDRALEGAFWHILRSPYVESDEYCINEDGSFGSNPVGDGSGVVRPCFKIA